MKLRYEPADEEFRAELAGWLADNPPPSREQIASLTSSANMPDWAREWQRTLFDAGWLVPGWSPERGGRDATPTQSMIYFEEFTRREIKRSTNPQGLSIVAPSILDYGTPEQIERFALPSLRAEISWCLGMSEPGAGSDLAGLQTRAVRDGERFVVNGQKVWTSGAQHADWCMLFARTDPDAPKHQGITALIMDMRSPGIQVRPLPELTEPDYADTNEVFLTDVEVPAENVLGELNGGWAITTGSLAHERAMLWIDFAYDLARTVEGMKELAARPAPGGGRIGDDPVVRQQIAQAHIDSQAMLFIGYRGFTKFARGKSSPEHSILKLYGSEAIQLACLDATEAMGAAALDRTLPAPEIWRVGGWAIQYLRSFAATIPGGTSEIQRNIIAERVLGLPR